jgi:hypothetical protein
LPQVPMFPVLPGTPGTKRPAPPGHEMSIDEVELVCEADDDIETLRGKLNEDPEEALWMRTFSEHFEVGDDGEDLDPEKVFQGQQKELKELDEFKVFKLFLRLMVPPGIRVKGGRWVRPRREMK